MFSEVYTGTPSASNVIDLIDLDTPDVPVVKLAPKRRSFNSAMKAAQKQANIVSVKDVKPKRKNPRPTKRPVIRQKEPNVSGKRPAKAAVDYKKLWQNYFKKKREDACRKKKKDLILSTKKKSDAEEILSNLLEYRLSIRNST